jgi:hypothetical protein
VPPLVREPLLRMRNRETLRRLSHLAEGRWRERPEAAASSGAGAT